MNWLNRLQVRWGAKGVIQVILILLVFCCTGLTVVYLMKPALFAVFGEVVPGWARVLYFVVILPVYNIVLLVYGFLFGQFTFFWEFEKKVFNRFRPGAEKKG